MRWALVVLGLALVGGGAFWMLKGSGESDADGAADCPAIARETRAPTPARTPVVPKEGTQPPATTSSPPPVATPPPPSSSTPPPPPPDASASAAPASDAVLAARADLDALLKLLSNADATTRELIDAIDAVAARVGALAGDPDAAAVRFRSDAVEALLVALGLRQPGASGQADLREDVVVHAAEVLGGLKEPKVSEGIIRWADKRPPKGQAPSLRVLRAAFGALGKLNEEKSLAWMQRDFVHVNNAPAEVDKLVAAHEAMVLFTGVKGRARFEVVKEMVKIYAATELRAEKAGDGDARLQALRQFWDRVKAGSIAAVQHFSGERLDSMAEFQEWLRTHNDPSQPPWTD